MVGSVGSVGVVGSVGSVGVVGSVGSVGVVGLVGGVEVDGFEEDPPPPQPTSIAATIASASGDLPNLKFIILPDLKVIF
ncbi:hypothetical protein C3941_24715 [Kaistia algarum]|nr:hypothetical protein C3941_24715 [Kaistia algarum]